MNCVRGIGWITFLILTIVGCGSSDKDNATTVDAANTGESDTTGDDGVGGSGGSTTTENSKCGDKTVDPGEDCDDGNRNDTDGCTLLCTYTCKTNAECELDECAGQGSTCDPNTHTCSKSDSSKVDGAACGDNKTCQKGKCIEIACNNGYKEGAEECDDGDKDDFNGCNAKCKFSCVKGDKTGACANDCDLDATCNEATHACKASTNPAPDNALCNSGLGYCKSGQCVLSKCGDGTVQPNEECDEGEKNNNTGSCTKSCTKAVCGNGKIEQKEQCDDGNTTNLDSCDSTCKVEFFFRATQLNMSEGTAPDWCYYSKKNSPNMKVASGNEHGNAMGTLARGMKQTAQTLLSSGTITDTAFRDMLSSTDTMILYQLLDLEDPSLKSADPVVTIGEVVGLADNTGLPDGGRYTQVSNEQKLDWPAQIYKNQLDKDLRPNVVFKAAIVVEGGKADFRTTQATTMGFESKPVDYDGGIFQGGKFYLRNLMIRMPVDEKRSKLKEPPKTADWVTIPETSGGFSSTATADPTAESTATGIICGAVDIKMMEEMPLPAPTMLGTLELNTVGVLCPDQANDPDPAIAKSVIGCKNGIDDLKAGKCASMADMMRAGCTGSGLIFMYPLGDPDVDVDADGRGDAYTMVAKVAVQRARVSTKGLLEGEGQATPLKE